LDNVVLPGFLSTKLPFLSQYGIEFGENIKGDYFTPAWFVVVFILILLFKNSNQYMSKFNTNIINILIASISFVIGLYFIMSVKFTEFLYFNF